jgi:hypothetical protein
MTKDLNLAIVELGIDDGDRKAASLTVLKSTRDELAAAVAELANGDPFIVADALRTAVAREEA